MWSGLLIGSIVVALLAVLGMSALYTRRLKRLNDAVEAFAEGGFTLPVRIAGADASGDEIDRLAAHVEGMSERIAAQIVALERSALQRRELLTNVSHDLRTPMASMQGYLELLLLHPVLHREPVKRRLPRAHLHRNRELISLNTAQPEDRQQLVWGPGQRGDFSMRDCVHWATLTPGRDVF